MAPRPTKRADGFPTRADMTYWTPAEHAIANAIAHVEAAGAHPALTDAVILLGKARDRVADFAEGLDPGRPVPHHGSGPDNQ